MPTKMTSYRLLSAAKTRQSTAIEVKRELYTYFTEECSHCVYILKLLHIACLRYIDISVLVKRFNDVLISEA